MIRADVAELLHAGLSDRAIAHQLRTDAKKVAAARAVLGLPKAKSGIRAAAAAEELFHARTEPLPGGHLRWTGSRTNHGVPAVRHGGRHLSAYRVAFRLRTGREPIGKARPACEMPDCVAPNHIDDQPARERQRATYQALFGGVR